MDISVILPVINEYDNLRVLLPHIHASLKRENVSYEIVVIDGGSIDGTREAAEALGARVIAERRPGFGRRDGDRIRRSPRRLHPHARCRPVRPFRFDLQDLARAPSRRHRRRLALHPRRHLLIAVPPFDQLDAQHSPAPDSLDTGARPVQRLPSLPRAALDGLTLTWTNFEVQQEILVRAYARGFSVVEVPFVYFPRNTGRSYVHMMRFGLDIARSAFPLWKLRNSLDSADYDERGFYSIIPIQRYWLRSRHRIFVTWARGAGRILDAGCGSSLTVQSLNNVIGMDFNFGKLRFLRRRLCAAPPSPCPSPIRASIAYSRRK